MRHNTHKKPFFDKRCRRRRCRIGLYELPNARYDRPPAGRHPLRPDIRPAETSGIQIGRGQFFGHICHERTAEADYRIAGGIETVFRRGYGGTLRRDTPGLRHLRRRFSGWRYLCLAYRVDHQHYLHR